MRILVTSGATREPIDAVRFISNISTGATGAKLTEIFNRAGHQVSLIAGEGALLPKKGSCELYRFSTFQSLDLLLQGLLKNQEFEAVVHLAAVGDFSVEAIEVGGKRVFPDVEGKLSSNEDLTLKLKRNFKIVDRIKSYALLDVKPKLVAFKLSAIEDLDAVKNIFEHASVDFVVQNDVAAINQGERKFKLYDSEEQIGAAESVSELGVLLLETLGSAK